MTETEVPVEAPNLETPGDSPEKPAKRTAKRGRTYRCFEDGDYMPLIMSDGASDLPAGVLSPIVKDGDGHIHRFLSLKEAEAWLRANGSDYAGRVVMIMCAKKKFTVVVRSEPQIKLDESPRTLVTDPEEEASDG